MSQDQSNKVVRYYQIRTVNDVPYSFKTHPNFDKLTKDPAHGSKVVPGSLREAMAAIEAERQGKVKPIVNRTNNGYIDFIDGDGKPYDIKTPPSPPPGKNYPFNEYAAGSSVISQLGKTEPNAFTGKEEPVSVLLDTTYLTDEDRSKLMTFIKENTTKEQQARVVEINIDFDNNQKQQINPNVINKLKRAGR